MKKLLLTTLFCWLSIVAMATDLKVTLSDFTVTPSTNRTVYVSLLTVPTASSASTIIGTRITYTTDTNGVFYISNVVQNALYSMSVQAPPSRTDFTVEILDTDTGLINAHSNMVAFSTSTFPAGSVAWSAVTSDLRYLRSGTPATNVVWPVAGANITAVTNGLAVTLSSSATGGGVGSPGRNLETNSSTINVVTNPVFTTAFITNPAASGSSAQLSISGNTGNGGFQDLLTSSPASFSFTLGGSRAVQLPKLLDTGTEIIAGGSTIGVALSLTNGSGSTTAVIDGPSGSASFSGQVTGTGSSNYFSGSLSLSSNVVYTPRTIVLSTNNGDVSLIIGTNAVPGMNWRLMPGIYYCTNWMKVSTNGSITGSGANATTLVNLYTNNGTVPALIAGSDNGYISDLTITNFYYDKAVPDFQACIGAYQDFARVSGGAVIAGQGGYTNLLVERCILYGGSDNIYNRHTNNCYGVFRNCKLTGPWDVVTFFGTSTQQFDFWFCDFDHTVVASHGNAKDIFVTETGVRARFRSYFSTFSKTNGIQANDYYVNLADTSKQTAEYYYCTFTNANPGVSKFYTFGTGLCPFTFVGCNVNLTEVGDDASTSTSLVLGTNVAHTYILAGDSANGITVSETTSWPTKADLIFTAADGGYFSAGFSAGTITNRFSVGGRLQITDANGKLIDATASSSSTAVAGNGTPILIGGGLLLSGGTLSATGPGGAIGWATNGNNATGGEILGTLTQFPLRFVAYSNEVAVFDTNNTIRMGRGQIIQTNTANDASIWGGWSNKIQGASTTSSILGGHENVIGLAATPVIESVILGGRGNTNFGSDSLIWGYANNIGVSSISFVGGHDNFVCDIAGGIGSFIGSGTGNYIGTNAIGGVLVGGQFNNISNGVSFAVISGGYQNSISGSSYGAIPGGFQNQVGALFGFAAGNRAKSTHQGAFVWGDSTSADQNDTGVDSFTIRASGGFYLTNSAKGYLQAWGNSIQSSNTTAARAAVLFQTNTPINSLIYFGTNWPGNGHGTDIGNGSIGSTNLLQIDALLFPGALMVGTNGNVYASNTVQAATLVAVAASGSNYMGANLNVNGTINFLGGTNTGAFTSIGSNYLSQAVVGSMATPTNSGSSVSFDFTKLVSLLTTNNAFVTLGVSGKDTTGKDMQWCTLAVTNSAGLGAAFVTNITFAANTHVIGPTTLNLTNWTELLCEYWPPNGPTNVFVTPCW